MRELKYFENAPSALFLQQTRDLTPTNVALQTLQQNMMHDSSFASVAESVAKLQQVSFEGYIPELLKTEFQEYLNNPSGISESVRVAQQMIPNISEDFKVSNAFRNEHLAALQEMGRNPFSTDLFEAALKASMLHEFPVSSSLENSSTTESADPEENGSDVASLTDFEVREIQEEVSNAKSFSDLRPETRQRIRYVFEALMFINTMLSGWIFPYYLSATSEDVMKELHQATQAAIVSHIDKKNSELETLIAKNASESEQRDIERTKELRAMRRELSAEIRRMPKADSDLLEGNILARQPTNLYLYPNRKSDIKEKIIFGKVLHPISMFDSKGTKIDYPSRAWILVAIHVEGVDDPVTGWVLRSHTISPVK